MAEASVAAKQSLLERHRREVQAHCYRMLGSLADAEDAIQDAMLRAHRSLDGLHDAAAARAWLYRIATNVCLDRLSAGREPAILDPCPDSLWQAAVDPGPEAHLGAQQSVALAFLAALRELPGLQRAVLLLRDVLGWSAAEVAELLEQSVPAVNSALQRARARVPVPSSARATAVDAPTSELLSRYLRAWEERDAVALTSLLREDARLTMPPGPGRLGRAAILGLLGGVFAGLNELRVLPVSVAGGPGFACYHRAAGDALFRPHALQGVEVSGDAIAALHTYLDTSLFARFGLPESLP